MGSPAAQSPVLFFPLQMAAPAWADAALAERALRSAEGSAAGAGGAEVRVRRVEAAPMTAPGENFASRMLQLRVTLEGGGVRSLVLKCEAEDDAVRESIRLSGFFPREIAFLTQVYPRMQAFLDDAAPGRYPYLAPRCLLHGEDPDFFLVMNDLREQGFKMANRLRGLGLRHALLALSALGRFHGASAAVLAREPALADGLSCPWGDPDQDPFNNVIKTCFQMAGDSVLHWPDFPQEYSRVLIRMKDHVYEKFASLCKPKPGGFNVIVHADFWTNNIMFRYENGIPIDVRLIDFQIAHVSSPAMDILRFLYSSLSENVIENHLDLLVREYHAVLKETMELLGLSAPSLEDFWKDLDVHGLYSLFGVIVCIPFSRAETGRAPDMDSAMRGEGGISNEVYSSPKTSGWLGRILIDIRKRGWMCWEEFQ